MGKSLLVDWITQSGITETIKERDGKLLINGVLQRADAKNQNGRVYPKKILDREVRKYKTLIKERRAMGELDHPDSTVINLNNVSHLVVDMFWKGDDLFGVIEVLPTPSGKILEALLKSDVKVGISSRGMGSVSESGNGANEVQDDFELLGFDMVSNPSTHGAFMYPVNESVNKYGDACINKYCKIQEIITEILIGG